MSSVLFIAKTDLNTDGRILNQLNILKQHFGNVQVDFILLPDQKTTIQLEENVNLIELNTFFRNNIYLRFFTVIQFSLKAFWKMIKIKPKVIHAQDSAIVIPVLLYRIFNRNKTYFIYDDHELPNEKVAVSSKIFNYFENFLIQKSNTVIFANEERLKFLKDKLRLTNELFFFLNLPYYADTEELKLPLYIHEKLEYMQNELDVGVQMIIHQGPLKVERGRQKLAHFVKLLPVGYKILLVGGTKNDYERFKKEYHLPEEKFVFIGRVNYEFLKYFWHKAAASIVLYLPTYINNRLCAPNRLYLSYFNNIPLLVNEDNPVLNNFIINFKAGVTIESFLNNPIAVSLKKLTNFKIKNKDTRKLLDLEMKKIVGLYKKLLQD